MDKLIGYLKTYADVLIVLTLGLVLRLNVIGRDDVWYDEAFTGLMMRSSKELFLKILTEDPHPPLFYLLMKGWTTAFGVNDISLRLFSVLFGMLTIFLVYVIARLIFSKNAATISALLVAVNPFLIDYSVEARSYSFYGFIGLLAFFSLVQKKYNLLALLLCVLALTHYLALAFVPPLLVLFLYQQKRDGVRGSVLLRSFLRFVPLILVLAALYRYNIASSYKNMAIDWAERASFRNLEKSIMSYSFGIKSRLMGKSQVNDLDLFLDENVLGWVVFAVYLVSVAAVAINKRVLLSRIISSDCGDKSAQSEFVRLEKFLYLVLLVFMPQLIYILFGLLGKKTMYVERYIFPAAIFFLMSVSYLLDTHLRFEIALIVLLIYCSVLTRIQPPKYYRGLKEVVKEYRTYPGEVVFTSPADYTVGKYYFTFYANNGDPAKNKPRIKLYDPQHPGEQYLWWWYLDSGLRPVDLATSVIITPEDTRMTPDFQKIPTARDLGSYGVYVPKL